MNRVKKVVIKGLFVGILSESTKGLPASYYRRKIVSPQFIELWYKVSENEWDQALWDVLPSLERDYMALCAHLCKVENNKFQVALSKSFRDMFDRMKLLESSIKAGNISEPVIMEFSNILDRLVSSGQITQSLATRLKARVNNSMIAKKN